MIGVVLLAAFACGFAAGLPLGLWIRRDQIRAARDARFWAGWRAVCAQAAANRLGWPERLP